MSKEEQKKFERKNSRVAPFSTARGKIVYILLALVTDKEIPGYSLPFVGEPGPYAG